MFAHTTFADDRVHNGKADRMRKRSVSVAAFGIAATFALAACSSSGGSSTSSSPAGGSSSTPETSASSSAPPPSSSAPSSSTGGGTGGIDGKGAKVGIILPDTTSSPRWVSADPQGARRGLQEVQPGLPESRTPTVDTGKEWKTIARADGVPAVSRS